MVDKEVAHVISEYLELYEHHLIDADQFIERLKNYIVLGAKEIAEALDESGKWCEKYLEN